MYFPVVKPPMYWVLFTRRKTPRPSARWTRRGRGPCDPDAIKYRDPVPAFHVYGTNGEAEDSLMYVDHGRFANLLAIERPSFPGKIALARYDPVTLSRSMPPVPRVGLWLRRRDFNRSARHGGARHRLRADLLPLGRRRVGRRYARVEAASRRLNTELGVCAEWQRPGRLDCPLGLSIPSAAAYQSTTCIKARGLAAVPSLPIS